jgi:isopenicillin-N N-acyltransferase-like protein
MSALKGKFPLIYLSGDNYEAGKQHGEKLKKQIEFSYSLYQKFLFSGLSDYKLAEIGKRYLECFSNFIEDYVAEIEGIAAGASFDPWKIAVLNARNELHHYLKGRFRGNECTAIFLPESGILAQNWDWAREFENLAVIVLRERPDGHQILQLAEPGVIGKIGFNTSGLGACLNFLPGRNNRIGIPVHLLLRSILDSASIEEAEDKVQRAGSSSFSNILIADQSGRCIDIELCERQKTTVIYTDSKPIHTNHYLSECGSRDVYPGDSVEEELFEDSTIRFNRAKSLLGQVRESSIGTAKRILGDRRNGKHAICSEYKAIMGTRIGTVCSIVMDLKKREMHITKGSPMNNAYEKIVL